MRGLRRRHNATEAELIIDYYGVILITTKRAGQSAIPAEAEQLIDSAGGIVG